MLDNFKEKNENCNKFSFTLLDITFAYLILEMLTRQASPFHCSLTIRCKFYKYYSIKKKLRNPTRNNFSKNHRTSYPEFSDDLLEYCLSHNLFWIFSRLYGLFSIGGAFSHFLCSRSAIEPVFLIAKKFVKISVLFSIISRKEKKKMIKKTTEKENLRLTWPRRSGKSDLFVWILALLGRMRSRFSFGGRHSLSAFAAQWNVEGLLQYHQ